MDPFPAYDISAHGWARANHLHTYEIYTHTHTDSYTKFISCRFLGVYHIDHLYKLRLDTNGRGLRFGLDGRPPKADELNG